jgi:hypothetical protein
VSRLTLKPEIYTPLIKSELVKPEARRLLARAALRQFEARDDAPPDWLLEAGGVRSLSEFTRQRRASVDAAIKERERRIDALADALATPKAEKRIDAAVAEGLVAEADREEWVRQYVSSPAETVRALEEARELQEADWYARLGIATPEQTKLVCEFASAESSEEAEREYGEWAQRLGVSKDELI